MDIRSIAANQTPLVDVAAFVFAKLIEQGVPSKAPGSRICRYRATAPNGARLACGVGQLIADADYTGEMECHGAADALTLAYGDDWVHNNVPPQVHHLLDFLQNVHDNLARSKDPSMTRANLAAAVEAHEDAVQDPYSVQACRAALELL